MVLLPNDLSLSLLSFEYVKINNAKDFYLYIIIIIKGYDDSKLELQAELQQKLQLQRLQEKVVPLLYFTIDN